MSSEVAPDYAIHAEGLRKQYRLGERLGIGRRVRRMIGRTAVAPELVEALDDLTLTVRRGECLGVVGRNGCGKSTFLQMISEVTVPTAGSLHVRGLVLPLLSVGSGFHPELTGRENVVLFGVILGLERRVIEDRMEAVIAFAGLERHIDTPTKRYSDGMQARLSFAIGMQLPADIYILDEVLATVDGEFLGRCLEEIGRLTQAGKTVLFVSHDLTQLRAQCDRVLWMHRGRINQLGPAREVLDEYELAGALESS